MKIKFTKIDKGCIRIAITIAESYINTYLNASQTFIFESKTIVSELISNAVIHAEPTFIELELLHNQDRLFITVEDNGLGIDDIEKAKEPLYSTKEERAGLGFTIVDLFSNTLAFQETQKEEMQELRKELDVVIRNCR